MQEIKHIPHFTDNYTKKSSGFLAESDRIIPHSMINGNGATLTVINYGATVTSLQIPLGNGKMTDVVLGFDRTDSYLKSFALSSAPYFGATIGRYAGRISNGKFELNGETCQLSQNSGDHSLHGGEIGLSQAYWKIRKTAWGKNPSITFIHTSADGDENFPGELTVELTYTLTEQNEFVVRYSATSTRDTVLNLTHHSYFNLEGQHADLRDQELLVNAGKILETTAENIPTGRFLKTANCPFDFTVPKKCPESIDTTFVLNKDSALAASLFSRKNNLKMEVYTDQPAVHIYVGGDCFGQLEGKENSHYHALSGICFETQHFPDAPNHAHFPSTILKKGDTYKHETVYKFQIS